MLLHKTKIIATVGPASNKYETLVGLVSEGVNVGALAAARYALISATVPVSWIV